MSVSDQDAVWCSDALLYVLWHDEQVEDADQSREDERQNHSAGEVLVIQLMILEKHSTRHAQTLTHTQLTHAEKHNHLQQIKYTSFSWNPNIPTWFCYFFRNQIGMF